MLVVNAVLPQMHLFVAQVLSLRQELLLEVFVNLLEIRLVNLQLVQVGAKLQIFGFQLEHLLAVFGPEL